MKPTISIFKVLTLCVTLAFLPKQAWSSLFDQVAQEKQVNASILWLIALQESAPPGTLIPHPWTANFNGRGYYYSSREEAYFAIKQAVNDGFKVDVGLMQVNWFYHADRFNNDLWSALDPLTNIRVASDILLDFSKHGTFEAIGRYHCPNWQLDWCKDKAHTYANSVIRRLRHYE
ncbi:lytic transglycosylase [Thiomicrospira aerophila AL3]|uniref:Lytic transglycosylase n=1 Tax=Thiomicrospira aerophila AL3 TaxID=717772 RepID=W0DRY3_9GAMM|nr:transglycosylase SLT domain-containing protein [Thiomicrospira aerophila]AHF01395.1 lytic transglycosylase [Thiomicrospira aerophila AL3]